VILMDLKVVLFYPLQVNVGLVRYKFKAVREAGPQYR